MGFKRSNTRPRHWVLEVSKGDSAPLSEEYRSGENISRIATHMQRMLTVVRMGEQRAT